MHPWKHWLFLGSVFTSQPKLFHWTHTSRQFKQKDRKCMGNGMNMFWHEVLLYWSELIYKDKTSTFQDVINWLLWLNSHVKYNKAVLYAPSLIQQGIMLIADILTTDHDLCTLTQLNIKFNLPWQEYTYDKLISAIPIEVRTLIQPNTSTTCRWYQPLLYTAKSIKRKQQNSIILHSWNNTLLRHKMQSINEKETCTQMKLTLNGKQYAPKYVTLFLWN